MDTSEKCSGDERPAEPLITLKGDCYSDGERRWMEYGQHLRAVALRPVLARLTAARVTPDHLTLASLVSGLAFAPLWWSGQFGTALSMLWLHVVLDGLDGPLARAQKVASVRGSFTDSFCDQLVVTVVTITLMVSFPHVSIPAGTLFLSLYTGVLAIAMVRNSLSIPYSWLLRPRLILYMAASLEVFQLLPSGATAGVVWFSNAVLGLKLLTGFRNLRSRLEGPVRQ